MRFDEIFAEQLDHFGQTQPLAEEEVEGVTLSLTKEEAMAIHGFLQGEGFEHDAWSGVRTQLDELAKIVGTAVAGTAARVVAPKAVASAAPTAGQAATVGYVAGGAGDEEESKGSTGGSPGGVKRVF